MPKIIYGGLIKNRIKHSMIENEFNKKNEKLALKANLLAKKNKNIRKFKPIIYGDLYNKRIAESEKEDIIKKRLSQLAYSARNGQRQQEGKPQEGVILPGQVALLNQPPVISAITKEMINEYHEAEKLKPLIIDGEIRKYNKALYKPTLTFDTELESTDKIDRLAEEYNAEKIKIVKKMTDIDNEIISTDDYIKRLRNNPLTSAINFITLQKEIKLKEKLKKEYKQLEKELDSTNIQIRNLKDDYDDVIKHNAEVGKRNREEVKKFEQSLNEVNKNRLNLQQQPNETEYDYYKRLREIETEKYDPLLYKQYAENEQTKILKTNLHSLFDNTSFNEDILSKIPTEDKFIINKNFDEIEEAFLNEYGYNAKISPKQVVTALKTLANIYKKENVAASTINNAIRNQLAKRKLKEEKTAAKEEKTAASTINNAIRNQLAKRKINKLKEEKTAASTINNAVKNQLAKRELNKLKEEKAAAAIINNAIESQLAKRKVKYLKMSKEAKEKYKNINPSYNLQYKPPPLSTEPFVPKFIQDANEKKRKNMELYKRYKKIYYPSSNLATSNESLAANKLKQAYRSHLAKKELINRQIEKSEEKNAANKLKQAYRSHLAKKELIEKSDEKNAANKLKQAYRSHLAKKELINRQIEKSEKNNAVKDLQRFARKRLAEDEYDNLFEELSKATTASDVKVRKQRSDKGVSRGSYKQKKPLTEAIPREAIEANLQNYEPPAARKESGTGLRGRHHPKKRMVKTTKEEQMKNRLFLITKEIKAGNDNHKLIIESDKLYKKLYGINQAHLFLKK